MNKFVQFLEKERHAPMWQIVLMYIVATIIALSFLGGFFLLIIKIVGNDNVKMSIAFAVVAIVATLGQILIIRIRNK